MGLQSFTLTYNGLTQTLAAWGLSDAQIAFKSFEPDEFTFKAPRTPFDAAALFPYKAQLVLKNSSGKIVFVGNVAEPAADVDPHSDKQTFLVKGPWWFFDRLVFQEEWNIEQGVASGEITGTLIPTLRTSIVVGNQSDGTSENLGQVCTDVINYVLATAAAATPPFVPFQLGSVTPTTTIPLTDVSDLTCAQIIKTIFSYVPDAGAWFDYSTLKNGLPCPTLYIGRRDNLTPVSLPCYGRPTTGIKLRPRNDLVVPAVIVKYVQTNTIDGEVFSQITPDIWPANAPDPAFDNLVVDVNLLPGNETYQKQTLLVTDRPKDYDSIAGTGVLSAATIPWVLGEHRAPWLKGYTIPANTPSGDSLYPQGNAEDYDVFVPIDPATLQVRRVVTTLTENSKPLDLGTATVAPGGGPNSGGTGINLLDILSEELISGTVPPWLTENQNIYSAKVNVAVTLQYLGSDPVVQKWFSNLPTAILTFNFPTVVTNGSSTTYSQLASETPSEPMPVGLAKQLYEGLSVLHYEGTVEITEQEISGEVGMGNSLNLAGGAGAAAAFVAMNAQPYGITWNIDKGITMIKVGPPQYLSAGKLTDILRAERGRIPSYHVSQQQTGKADGDNSVQGAGDTSRSGATSAPLFNSAGKPLPWAGTISGSPGAATITINPLSYLMNSAAQGDTRTINGLGTPLSINSSAGSSDFVYLEQPVSGLAASGNATLTTGSVGGSFTPTLAAWDASGKGYLANDGAFPPNQTFFRVLIGTIMTGPAVGGVTPLPVYTPCCINNLLIFNEAVNGIPDIMAYPTNSAS